MDIINKTVINKQERSSYHMELGVGVGWPGAIFGQFFRNHYNHYPAAIKTAGLSGQADKLKQMIHRWHFSAFLPMQPQRTLGQDIWPGLPPGWSLDPGGTDGRD